MPDNNDGASRSKHDYGGACIDDLWAATERDLFCSSTSRSVLDHCIDDTNQNVVPVPVDFRGDQQEYRLQSRHHHHRFVSRVDSDMIGSMNVQQEVVLPNAGKRCEDGVLQEPTTIKAAFDHSTHEVERRLVVDHSYADFSSVNDSALDESVAFYGETLQSILQKGGATRTEDVVKCRYAIKRSMKTFPEKLMEVLSRSDDADCVRCITWLPHGRSFKIIDQDYFMKEICPRYFKATQYKSFTRQFNLWGFKRITNGVDAGAYYHQMFLRGMPNLAKAMCLPKNAKTKGYSGGRLMANPDAEPDFYELEKIRPLMLQRERNTAARTPMPPKQVYGISFQNS
eukprot:CAMPEP_0116039464 /NCGR_PEP_ID=MMETSP0321-20121206/23587_1 /TAXON_ID=163516 /ORGANISM="Leptocylindrus danicus var. danicus, Strain B650" /LENGTH=340 /DNA_ID=CAMNT_0003518709 /DNA_START=96 /DNA_END=1118 /DNA_ORIENTATION=+